MKKRIMMKKSVRRSRSIISMLLAVLLLCQCFSGSMLLPGYAAEPDPTDIIAAAHESEEQTGEAESADTEATEETLEESQSSDTEATEEIPEESQSPDTEQPDTSEQSEPISESETETHSETETQTDTEADGYDIQPGSLAEVEEIISEYKETLGKKPRWQNEVQSDWMPLGYLNLEVTDDQEFGKPYYTFTAEEGLHDLQPTSLREVQRIITEYEAEFNKNLEEQGIQEAIKIRKPHWKYEVKNSFMPRGYICEEVTEDEEFPALYYTFFAKIKTLAASWQGAGTASEPYEIATPQQLAELSDNVAGGETYAGEYFVLTRDISLSDYNNWKPIGGSMTKLYYDHTTTDSPRSNPATYSPFKGNFDGAGYTISDLKVTAPWATTPPTIHRNDYKGLFGVIEDAAIKDLVIRGAQINGGAATGTLAGYAYGDVSITGVKIEGTTISAKNTAGAGRNAYNIGFGGLLGIYDHDQEESGRVYNLDITDCSVTGLSMNTTNAGFGVDTVTTGSTGAGGIVGMIRSYRVRTGGLMTSTLSVSISKPELSGTVQSSAGYTRGVGGIIGSAYLHHSSGNSISISEPVIGADITMSGPYAEGAGGVVGEYFVRAGANNNLDIYAPAADVNVKTTGTFGGGVGGVVGRTHIRSYLSGAASLYAADNKLNILNTGDKRGSVTGTVSSTGGAGSTSVGGVIGLYLSGVYSGNSIKNTDPASLNNGEHTVRSEINIEGIDVGAGVASAYGYVGGVAGQINFTDSRNITDTAYATYTGNQKPNEGIMVIRDCSVSGNISSTAWHSGGGIIGIYQTKYAQKTEALIEDCHTSGNVALQGASGFYAGGIIGYSYIYFGSDNAELNISKCSASGEISGEYYCGGLAGYLEITGGAGFTSTDTMHTYVRDSYATGDVSTRTTFSGGLVGHAHGGAGTHGDIVVFERCWASGDVRTGTASTAAEAAGGFVGDAMKSITFKDCYATGDVHGNYYHNGGFAGTSRAEDPGSQNKFFNCYATGNVYGSSFNNGGFVGRMWNSHATNCYAVGSVNSASSANGGFAGLTYGSGVIKNCFSSGTVRGGANTNGFVGSSAAGYSYQNCFYDTTTSTRNSAGGAGISGVSTTDMIDPDTFSNWNILNVWHVSAANRQKSDSDPWYIDKDATYPYLYYQADGFDTDGSGDGLGDGYLDPQRQFPTDFDNTNYFLGVVYAVDGSGNRKVMAPYRYDYEYGSAANLSFEAMTVGSNRAYFPYAVPQGLSTYNTRQFWFEDGIKNSDSDGPQWLDTNRTYNGDAIGKIAFGANQKISFGSYSRTNIVAFSAGPNAVKSNNAPVWEDGDKTYVGNKTTYRVDFTNYSTTSAWKQVEMADPLPKGVTLANDWVFLYHDEQEIMLENMTGDSRLGEDEYKYNQYELDQMGGGKTAIPYFIYYQDGERYTLEVYNLPELDVAIIGSEGVKFDEYHLEFVAQVEEAAMTPEGKYPEDKGIVLGTSLKDYKEDNIRNRGDAPGVMHFYNPLTLFDPNTGYTTDNRDPLIVNGVEIAAEVVIPLDDEDIDPVYLGIIITYDSNHRNFVGSQYEDGSPAADTRIDKDYMHVDKDTHKVIPNDDPNVYEPPNEHPRYDFTDFSGPGDKYIFDGWFFFVEYTDEIAYQGRGEGLSGDELEEALTDEPLEKKVVAISLSEIGISDDDAYWLKRTGHANAKVMQAVEERFAEYGGNDGRNHDKVVRLTLYAKWKLKSVDFTFIKKNLKDEGLVDVEFDLYYWEGSTAPAAGDKYVIPSGAGMNVGTGKWVKTNDTAIKSKAEDTDRETPKGYVKLEFFETGYYQLVETTTLTGYYLPEVQWQFVSDLTVNPYTLEDPVTIGKSGENPYIINFSKKQVPETEADPEYDWSLVNYYLNAVKIEKKGPKGDKLNGAEFALERYKGSNANPSQDTNAANWTAVSNGTTGSGGNATGEYQFGKDGSTVNTLAPGHYRIKETKAAAGHTLLKEPVYFELPLEYIGSVPEGVNISDADYTHRNDEDKNIYGFIDITYTITDEANFEMPKSGRIDMRLYSIIIGAVILLLGAGMYGIYRKKRGPAK